MRGVGRFAIDAGGSHTRVLFAGPDGDVTSIDASTINPSASGPAAADDTLRSVLEAVAGMAGHGPVVGWLASASIDTRSNGDERSRLRRLVRDAGLSATLVLSNDVLPLLFGVPALAAHGGVVVVCGTGSGFLGRDAAGRVVGAGGCEYLGSDEGSAVDIGWRGLRAAVRATDGRGAATGLVERMSTHAGQPARELAREIALGPYPKRALAGLAPLVCAAWLAGDEVAGEIVGACIAELCTGVRAVGNELGLPAGFAVATVGGVLTGCPAFATRLEETLRGDFGVGVVQKVTSPVTRILAALDRILAPDGTPVLPPYLRDRHAWLLRYDAYEMSGTEVR
ncbi:BadF/BadG/BcrA/BcrD ATPase family protein [Polymorphospora rubra]|uniref:BadF/BadG/BcrA/BcrD ATPase family protein n=1 Tax=Polymorphospora rubra TaxID=338584 RepID=UPI0033CD66E3